MTSFTVHCTHCDTAFPVDPEKVPDGGVRARCTNCEGIFFVAKPVAAAATVAAVAPEAAPEPDLAAPPEPAVAPEPELAGAPEPEADDAAVVDTELAVEVEAAVEVEPEQPVEVGIEPEQDDSGFGSFDDEIDVVGSSSPAAAVEAVEEEVGAEPEADVVDDFEITTTPEVDVVESSLDAVADVAEEISPVAPVEEAEAEQAPDEIEEEIPAVPTGFQFGKRDPHEKARRLARVLVSDMITYNPDRHSQALSRGTLEEDFEDEIGKSWQEYVDQVGAEMAQSTSYWTDALNEVLAKGEEIF